MRNLVAGFAGLVVMLVAKTAWATFHIMKITEVFPGTMAQPNAQYVELQMYAIGQNLVQTHSIVVYDAAGTSVGTYTFAAQVPNGNDQATILIATTEAATLFNVTPDLTMMPTIPLAGGMVCFDNVDCVAWGNFTGTTPPNPVGKPAYQVKGLLRGRSLTRSLKGNATLEAGDDTGVSADDFQWATPTPKTNPGTNGTPPTSTCGNNTVEGLESCDDNNTMSNDGCSSMCVTESCGDGVVQMSEQCDDTNANEGDGCSTACVLPVVADDIVPPDGPSSDGDGGGCCQAGGPGAAPGLALLVLGLLLRRRRLS
jgi:uncharacterized protein (TIGR03382 family)